MKKKTVKLILDLAMIVILLLSYNKRSVSMAFHEIAGMALMGGVVLHLILNRQWIAGITKKFFTQKLPARTRAAYIVDFLLLVGFVCIGVSAVMISKVLFSFNGGMVFKTIHYFASAACLILLGIHLGLHLPFFASTLGRGIRLPAGARRVLAVVLTLVICAWGCRSMVTTSFFRWLSMPFSSSASFEGGEGQHQFQQGEAQGSGTQTAAAQDSAQAAQAQAVSADTAESSAVQAEATAHGSGNGSGNGQGFKGGEGGEGMNQGFSLATALGTLANFFSITYVFAALTVLAEKVLRCLRPAPRKD